MNMKKKVIRLTESELVELVQRVIKEDESQSAEKTSIMSSLSDLDLTGINLDINKIVDMGMGDDETPPEISPNLKGDDLNKLQVLKKQIVDEVSKMCQSGKQQQNILDWLKSKIRELKGKHGQVSEQYENLDKKFYLWSAMLLAGTALLCFIYVKIKNRDGCAKFARWRDRNFVGYK